MALSCLEVDSPCHRAIEANLSTCASISSRTLVRMLTVPYRNGPATFLAAHDRVYVVSTNGRSASSLIERATEELTRTFSSGKPPSTFLSHMSSGGRSARDSHTLNLPPVSSEFKGRMVTALMTGVGNVSMSSVAVHVARCCLRRRRYLERWV